MKWFRLVRQKYISFDSDIISGQRAKVISGRWHPRGVPTLYLAQSPEIAFAECGKYWICDEAERLNRTALKLQSPPSIWLNKYAEVSCIDAYLAEVEVDPEITGTMIELSQEPPASAGFGKAGFPDLTIQDTRANSYLAIEGQPTRKIGEYFVKSKASSIKVQSARFDGTCAVLYPDNFLPTQVKVINKTNARLYALDLKGKRIAGNKVVELDERNLEYEQNSGAQRIAPLRL